MRRIAAIFIGSALTALLAVPASAQSVVHDSREQQDRSIVRARDGSLRINAPIGEVKLDINRVTRGIARGANAEPSEPPRAKLTEKLDSSAPVARGLGLEAALRGAATRSVSGDAVSTAPRAASTPQGVQSPSSARFSSPPPGAFANGSTGALNVSRDAGIAMMGGIGGVNAAAQARQAAGSPNALGAGGGTR